MILRGFRIQVVGTFAVVALVGAACSTGSTASEGSTATTSTPQTVGTSVAPSTAAATQTTGLPPNTTDAPPTTAPPTTTIAVPPTTAPPTTTIAVPPTTSAPAATLASTTTVAPATDPVGAGGATADGWANFRYRSAECGSFTPITLTDGGFFNQESAIFVELVESVELDSGDTLVELSCLAGASGGTQSTELLLFGADANELDYKKLPLGDTTISSDGFGSIEYEVWTEDDPRCCPSGQGIVTFAVVDRTIVVDEPEIIIDTEE